MRKKEFIEKVRSMKKPELTKESCLYCDLVCTYWLVSDKGNIRNHFCTPAVRLSERAYLSDRLDYHLDRFNQREEAHDKKYTRWFNEAVNQM